MLLFAVLCELRYAPYPHKYMSTTVRGWAKHVTDSDDKHGMLPEPSKSAATFGGTFCMIFVETRIE